MSWCWTLPLGIAALAAALSHLAAWLVERERGALGAASQAIMACSSDIAGRPPPREQPIQATPTR